MFLTDFAASQKAFRADLTYLCTYNEAKKLFFLRFFFGFLMSADDCDGDVDIKFEFHTEDRHITGDLQHLMADRRVFARF